MVRDPRIEDAKSTPKSEDERMEPMSDVDRSIAEAPLPTVRTLRRRKSLLFQTLRFAAFNLRMMKMVTRAHH